MLENATLEVIVSIPNLVLLCCTHYGTFFSGMISSLSFLQLPFTHRN